MNRFILLFLILYSCSTYDINSVDPRDYQFRNEYINLRWEQFLQLEECEKLNYMDSLVRPIFISHKRFLKKKLDPVEERVKKYDSLANGNESLYYWMFREIERITNRGPKIFTSNFGYKGLTNNKVFPSYDYNNPMKPYLDDYHSWKDSLGCD